MDTELECLILTYIGIAEELFPKVASHVGASLPISNLDWACLRVEQFGKTEGGIEYFKHGYGVHMNDGARQIDFDLGKNGETNGFDAPRLFQFAEANGIATPFENEKAVQAAINSAVEEGDVIHEEHELYYLRNRVQKLA